jgi:hypothetical protein
VSREEFQLIYMSVTRSFNSLDMPANYRLTGPEIVEFKNLVRRKKIILT